VAAESGGDFYKPNSFNVGGGGRSKANTSGAASSYSCPGSNATSAATSAVASGTAATAATTLDEHVSRANSRRLVGRPLITDTDTETKNQTKSNKTNQTKPIPKPYQPTETLLNSKTD